MMKPSKLVIPAIALAAACCPGLVQGQAGGSPRQQTFDYTWTFALGDHPGASAQDFDDTSWRTLDLPHDWSIEGTPERVNPTGGAGGYYPAGLGWYRKAFVLPSSWRGKRISIYFEGVYGNTEVFVNGESLGAHPYGYTAFSHDLTPHLTYGARNVVAVRVDNSRQPNSRWYSGSGIYRHVWLVVTEPVHVGQWGVAITTPEIRQERATVQLRTLVKNETSAPQRVVLSTLLTDLKHKNVGSDAVQVDLTAGRDTEVVRSITVQRPLLWSPDSPNLYQAQLRILQHGRTLDATETEFGIRSLAYSARQGFLLNERRVILNGGSVHHDNGCLGAAAFDRAEERKVELLKAAGFNAVRTAHNPPSEAFLRAADRLGLLVIDEAFDGWRESKTPYDYARFFDAWWQRDLESMVLRDRNHPSIIIWSTGNEIIERTKPEAIETARKLATAIRRIDATRPVTSAMTTWDQGWEVFDPLFAVHDIAGYNYQLWRAPSDHERVPERIIVQTESYPRDVFKDWSMIQGHEYIIGDFIWTALDYLGEAGIGRYYYPGESTAEHWEKDLFPWHGAYCGTIDLTGWRKPISHYRSMLYNGSEKLYMAVREPNPDTGEIKLTGWAFWPTWESWTWPGHEGKDIQAEVYSRYPRVRLYLGDRLVGEQPTGIEQQFKAVFTLPYTPGTLRAVGVDGHGTTDAVLLQTAGNAARIKLTADRKEIAATGLDLSYVTVEITDRNAVVQPNANNRLHLSVDGPGVIAGTDNGAMTDLDSCKGATRKAWHGRALIVVRSTRSAGDITLRVRADGLPEAALKIKAVKGRS